MHDLLNDLAKYVCGDICFRLGVDKPKNISITRHFSLVTDYNSYCDVYESLYYAKNARTFMAIARRKDQFYIWHCKTPINELFSKLKFLRVLSLYGCFYLKEVPDCVGDLKHLRSIDLSYTPIRKIPDSTCFLFNLQILKLNHCRDLEELPSNLHKLINLRFLEFMCTKVRKMPIHLGKLKNLQVLSPFYVGKSSEFSFQLLRELNLHGSLSIGELQNIVNPLDVFAANLKNKIHLVGLDLEWDLNWDLDDSIKERELLQNLQPSSHLKKLSIKNYGGTQFPSWLFDNSLSNMVSLKLKNCKCCLCLPPLGLLPFLRDMISQEHTHNHLKGLNNDWCPQFEAFPSEGLSASCLEIFSIHGLENLKSLPERMHILLPSLTVLSIYDCPRVELSVGGFPSNLQKLHLSNCSKITASMKWALRANASLKELSIVNVSVETFPDEDFLPRSLISLDIRHCPDLSLPPLLS